VVRIAFLDEAGRSRNEPIIVVAGIIVHGDRTYRELESRIRSIVNSFIPEADRDAFIFHAADIFHGTGYFKDRNKWPRELRWEKLHELASLPRILGMPVVFGHLPKAEYAGRIADFVSELPEHERAKHSNIAEHINAFARAEIAVERQMHIFPRNEICLLIAEDTDTVKTAVKLAHKIIRKPTSRISDEFHGDIPIKRIVDTPHFAAKSESPPLQVADVCAFLIRRRFARQDNSQYIFEEIAPQLTWTTSDFGDPMGSEPIALGSLY
jgi:hypothetical protein